MSELAMHIEALLFALGRSMTRKELGAKLGAAPEALEAALKELAANPRGIQLVDDGREVELRVAAGASALVERVRKEEYDRELGKAGQEALAAVLYRGPLTRAEVDFIRGVNSAQTLRTLTMRGLVRKVQNPKDERSFLYEPTTELFAHLGVSHADELPAYAETRQKLESLERAYRENAAQTETETP